MKLSDMVILPSVGIDSFFCLGLDFKLTTSPVIKLFNVMVLNSNLNLFHITCIGVVPL